MALGSILGDTSNLFFGNLRQRVGGAVGTLGTLVGAPELHLSENIAGSPAVTTLQTSPSGGGGLTYNTSENTLNPVAPTSGTTQPAPIQSGGGDGGGTNIPVVTSEQINAVAQPQLDFLNQLRAEEQAALPGYEQQLGEQRSLSEEKLAESERRGLETLSGQERQVQQLREQSLSKTRQLYNELSQRLAGMGSGSTASQPSSEILSREVAKSIGMIASQAAQEFYEINADRRNISEQVRIGNREIDADYNKQLSDIRETFRERVAAIDLQRGQLESWKAQKKIEELQKAREAHFALQDRKQAYEYQLQLWAAANNLKLDNLTADIQSVLPSQDWLQNYMAKQQEAILGNQLFGTATNTYQNEQPLLTGFTTNQEEQNPLNPFV